MRKPTASALSADDAIVCVATVLNPEKISPNSMRFRFTAGSGTASASEGVTSVLSSDGCSVESPPPSVPVDAAAEAEAAGSVADDGVPGLRSADRSPNFFGGGGTSP